MFSNTFRSYTMMGHAGASGLETSDYAWMTTDMERPAQPLSQADIEAWADLNIELSADDAEGEIRSRYEDTEDENQIQARLGEMRQDLESERDAIIAYLTEWANGDAA